MVIIIEVTGTLKGIDDANDDDKDDNNDDDDDNNGNVGGSDEDNDNDNDYADDDDHGDDDDDDDFDTNRKQPLLSRTYDCRDWLPTAWCMCIPHYSSRPTIPA